MTTQRAGLGRITAAIIAIAAMLPYLTLKVLWLSGNPLGVHDPALMADPTMYALNMGTFVMDFVGLLLALAFTMRWGMRLPAWLVLLPIWVGIGLLSQVVATVPVSFLLEGSSIFHSGPDAPLASWVYLAVYGGFLGQGAGLMAAFALYARDRWPAVLTGPSGSGVPFQRVIAWGVPVFAVPLGGIQLFWALGGTLGLAPGLVAVLGPASAVQQGFKGLLILAGAVALLMLVRGRGRFWPPLVVAWLGSGAMFAWGLYAMIMLVLRPPLTAGVTFSTTGPDLVELFSLLTGLVMGLAGAFLFVERSGGGVVEAAHQALEGEQREGDRQAAHHGHR